MKFKAQTHDLDLWPWPWVGMVDMGSAHRLTEANTWPKFNENLSKGSGDMERTRKCYGRTDGQTKAISIISHLLRGGGLKKKKKNGSKNFDCNRKLSSQPSFIVSFRKFTCSWLFHDLSLEPAHNKTYIKTGVISKDSDQPEHQPVWKGFSFILLWIARRLEKAHAISKDSDQMCADAQANMSLPWWHTSYCRFCHALAYFIQLHILELMADDRNGRRFLPLP